MTVMYAGQEYQVIEETDNEYRLQSLRDNGLIIRCLKNSSLLREKKNELENRNSVWVYNPDSFNNILHLRLDEDFNKREVKDEI